jgi:hypothetical protein
MCVTLASVAFPAKLAAAITAKILLSDPRRRRWPFSLLRTKAAIALGPIYSNARLVASR